MPLLRSSICFYLRLPRVPYRALPLFHPGLCRSVALTGLFSFFYLRLPRVPYRALPSFHPGLCRSAALAGLIVGLVAFTQGFISGFSLIPPWAMQECRPCRALCRIGRLRCCVVVLCSLNVFGVCKMDCCVRSCYCICLIVLFVGLGGLICAVGQ